MSKARKSQVTVSKPKWGARLTLVVGAVFIVWLAASFILPMLTQTATTAVGSSFSTPASGPPANVAQSANPSGALVPDFAIKTIDGETVTLSKERGNVLGMMFIAGWCVSCQPEAHTWGQLYAKYHSKGLDVLIVDVEQSETKDDLLAFKARARGGNHWWALDKDLTLVKAFQVRSLDTTYIIGRDGRVIYYDYWPTPADVLERQVLEALQ